MNRRISAFTFHCDLSPFRIISASEVRFNDSSSIDTLHDNESPFFSPLKITLLIVSPLNSKPPISTFPNASIPPRFLSISNVDVNDTEPNFSSFNKVPISNISELMSPYIPNDSPLFQMTPQSADMSPNPDVISPCILPVLSGMEIYPERLTSSSFERLRMSVTDSLAPGTSVISLLSFSAEEKNSKCFKSHVISPISGIPVILA